MTDAAGRGLEPLHLRESDVHEYVDGRLDEAAASRAAAHLAACDACDAEVRATELLVSWARQSRASVVAPSELWPLVSARTTQYAAVRGMVLRQLRIPLLLGAALLVLLSAGMAVSVTRWRLDREPVATLEQRIDEARRREAVARQRGDDLAPAAPVAPPAPGPPRGGGPQ